MSSRCMVAKVRLVVLAVGTLLLLTSTASAQHRDTFPGNDSLDQQLEAVLLGAGFVMEAIGFFMVWRIAKIKV